MWNPFSNGCRSLTSSRVTIKMFKSSIKMKKSRTLMNGDIRTYRETLPCCLTVIIILTRTISYCKGSGLSLTPLVRLGPVSSNRHHRPSLNWSWTVSVRGNDCFSKESITSQCSSTISMVENSFVLQDHRRYTLV